MRSFENLKEIYLKSVGGNCTLLLNIPPDKDGLIREETEKLFRLQFHPGGLQVNQAEEAEIEMVPSADCEGNDGSVLLEPGG